MKLLLLISAFAFLFLNCEPAKRNIVENQLSENYNCTVEIIKDMMPSITPKTTMYAIITLTPKSGVLEANWKIQTFKINQISYNNFDDVNYKGYNQAVYQNNVREIPIAMSPPFTVEIEFVNEEGKLVYCKLYNVELMIVH